jgi:hypothetical protein
MNYYLLYLQNKSLVFYISQKKALVIESFLSSKIQLINYLDFLEVDFFVVVFATVFADVFLGAAILLADVLLELFFAEDVFNNEDAFFKREEDLLDAAVNC